MLYTSFFSHEIMAMKKSYLPEDFWLKTIRCRYSNIIKIWLQKLSQNQLKIIKVSHVCFYLFFYFCYKFSKKKLRLLDCLISFGWFFFVCLFCWFCLHTTQEKLDTIVFLIDFWPKSMVFNGSGSIVQILEIIKFWSCLSSYSNTVKVKVVQNNVFRYEPLFRGWKMTYTT